MKNMILAPEYNIKLAAALDILDAVKADGMRGKISHTDMISEIDRAQGHIRAVYAPALEQQKRNRKPVIRDGDRRPTATLHPEWERWETNAEDMLTILHAHYGLRKNNWDSVTAFAWFVNAGVITSVLDDVEDKTMRMKANEAGVTLSILNELAEYLNTMGGV